MIYLACPEKYATGGTELMHQLYVEIRKYTSNVKMFYYNFSNTGSPVNERFENYNIDFVTNIIDSEENLLIIPEVIYSLLSSFIKIKKCMYWMSVDNYFKTLGIYPDTIKTIFHLTLNLTRGHLFERLVNFRDDEIIHFYQSTYARNFLVSKGVRNTFSICDPISQVFFSELPNLTGKNRRNRVLYNPLKGSKFTSKIINRATNIEFVPLSKDLSQKEVIYLFKTSKVYIDFGNHPGKDRFPREAAYLGCAVITGKRGSARNEKDVPIPSSFKFQDKLSNIPMIIDKINEIFSNYESLINDFKGYRYKIVNEPQVFVEDVEKLWKEYFKRYD